MISQTDRFFRLLTCGIAAIRLIVAKHEDEYYKWKEQKASLVPKTTGEEHDESI